MRLRSGLALATIALTCSGLGAAEARAEFVRDCSGPGLHSADTSAASNVLTRKVDCQRARRFIGRYAGPASAANWRCAEYETTSFADIHCTRPGGRVIHWQSTWRRQQLS